MKKLLSSMAVTLMTFALVFGGCCMMVSSTRPPV